MDTALRRLTEAIEETGAGVDDRQVALLAELCALQAQWAPGAGLSRYSTAEQVARGALWPVAACLALAPGPFGCWCEVGAGAGALGMGLAIALPHIVVTLVDRRERAFVFQEMMIRRLRLANCSAVLADLPRDAEHLGLRFDVVVERAVAPLPVALTACASVLRPGGRIIALRQSNQGASVTPCGLQREAEMETLLEGLCATAFLRPADADECSTRAE